MVEEVAKDDIEEEELEQDQYLVFTIKSQEFGIQAVRVQEISRVLDTTEVPNAPSYIEGIMNLRGRLASVINFRRKFGFELKKNDEDTRIIMVELGGFPIGIIVDSVEEVIRIPDEKVQDLPESTTTSGAKEFMTGVGMLESRLIILLDVDKVLTKTEMVELSKINRMMEKTEEVPEPTETKQVADKAKEASKPGETDQVADETEKSPETAETNQITDEVKDTPEPAQSKKTDAGQPANTAKRQAKRRA